MILESFYSHYATLLKKGRQEYNVLIPQTLEVVKIAFGEEEIPRTRVQRRRVFYDCFGMGKFAKMVYEISMKQDELHLNPDYTTLYATVEDLQEDTNALYS